MKKVFSLIFFAFSLLIGSCKQEFLPLSNFHADGDLVVQKSVQFVNLSGNADVYTWDFGDKAVSNEKDPIHIYKKSGKYTVRLIAKNDRNENTKSEVVFVKNAPNPLKEPDFVTIKSDVSLSQPISNLLTVFNLDNTIAYVMQGKKQSISLAYSDSSKENYSLLIQNWWTLKSIKQDSVDVSSSYIELFNMIKFDEDGSYVFFENSTSLWKWSYWCCGANSLDKLVFDAGSVYERMMQLDAIDDASIHLSFAYHGKILKLEYVKYIF